MVDTPLGALLRQWRIQRRLSLGALSARAAVAKSTISSWEQGIHIPRVPELEAVLATLGVPAHDRQIALGLIPRPRGSRARAASLASHQPELPEHPMPVPGHLLRAMRLRRNLSLGDVALRLGVRW